MKDKRTLSHKKINVNRRRRYLSDTDYRSRCIARSRRNIKLKGKTTSFNFDGEEYVLISKACELLNIRHHTFLRLKDHGIIPDLPKHPNGWRYIVRLSNVQLLKFAIQSIGIPNDDKPLIIPDLKDIKDFVYQYWNKGSEYITAQINV